jgi:rhodanese-related sulfurtransferase
MYPPGVPSVDAASVAAGAVILDVREPEEWVAGHIPGALHIPLADVPARLDELPDGEIVVICRSGGRSARAVGWLTDHGFEAINLTGGMGAWQEAGREMVSETGEAPTVR